MREQHTANGKVLNLTTNQRQQRQLFLLNDQVGPVKIEGFAAETMTDSVGSL